MSGGKTQSNINQGRNSMSAPRNSHIQNENQLRQQQGYQQGMVPQQQRQFHPTHGIAMNPQQRPRYGAMGRNIYSSSPQSMIHSFRMQNFQVVPQEIPYASGAPMMPPYIQAATPTIHATNMTAYPMQAHYGNSAYLPQTTPNMYYQIPNYANQQPSQTQQQLQSNANIPNNPGNMSKQPPKQKEKKIITIKNPTSKEDVTSEVLNLPKNTTQNKKTASPPIPISKNDKDKQIQADFAKQVAAVAKTDNNKPEQKENTESLEKSEIRESTDEVSKESSNNVKDMKEELTVNNIVIINNGDMKEANNPEDTSSENVVATEKKDVEEVKEAQVTLLKKKTEVVDDKTQVLHDNTEDNIEKNVKIGGGPQNVETEQNENDKKETGDVNVVENVLQINEVLEDKNVVKQNKEITDIMDTNEMDAEGSKTETEDPDNEITDHLIESENQQAEVADNIEEESVTTKEMVISEPLIEVSEQEEIESGEVTMQPELSRVVTEPKKKKRIKNYDKKASDVNLYDAYTDNPEPVETEPVLEKNCKQIVKKVEKKKTEDLSWEDKGEEIGNEIKIIKEDEPETAASADKLKYERDFLLGFQFLQVCKEKPPNLPDIEVVLDAPQQPTAKSSTSSRGADFLPSFARQKSQGGGGGRRDSRGSKAQPRKIIAPVMAPVELKKSENRWVRPSEKVQELSEEEKKTNELYRNVVAILNKLTPQKFKTLVDQVLKMDIDTPERLEGVIDRIFEKAIGEPVFSVAYANLCYRLFSIKVVGADEKDVSFRKLLLNRCQKEFEKEGKDELVLQEKMSHLQELSEDERKVKREEMKIEQDTNKRRMLGNIKFIGELFKLKLLTESIMHDCILKLLRARDEESLESMCKLLFTIGKDLDMEKAKPRIEQYFEQIQKIISQKKISSRVCFMLQDVVDLRANNWVPRREEHYNPKTIDQIHEEAKMEQKNAAIQAREYNKQQKKVGGRDSPKPNLGNDGWILSGRGGKPALVDADKLKSMGNKRAANVDEKISLGPSGRSFWQRGSTGGSSTPPQEQEPLGNRFSALQGSGDSMSTSSKPYDPRKSSVGARPRLSNDKRVIKNEKESALDAVRSLTKTRPETQVPSGERNETKLPKEIVNEKPQQTSLSQEEMARKTLPILKEFVNIEDISEALRCFKDLASPDVHDTFVVTCMEHTYEMNSKARKLTGRLLVALLKSDLSQDMFVKGLEAVFGNADENSMDYPKVWKYLAEILVPIVSTSQFTLLDLCPYIKLHLSKFRKAHILLAEILAEIIECYNKEKCIEIWSKANINWSDVLPSDKPVKEFLEDRNLLFLEDEMSNIRRLLKNNNTNDEIFECIEEEFNCEQRKECYFISQLANVVAEACISSDSETDFCMDDFKKRKNILHKYLDNKAELEVEVLYSLQMFHSRRNKPAKMLEELFSMLYDEELITEESFYTWKDDNDPTRQEAKGSAIQATSPFFEWLQSATEEVATNSPNQVSNFLFSGINGKSFNDPSYKFSARNTSINDMKDNSSGKSSFNDPSYKLSTRNTSINNMKDNSSDKSSFNDPSYKLSTRNTSINNTKDNSSVKSR